MAKKQMTRVQAIKSFLFAENTPNAQILKEFKELTDKDKEELAAEILAENPDVEIVEKVG